MALETSPRVAGAGPADRQRRSPAGSTGSARSGSRARSPRSAGARASSTVFLTLRDPVADISVPVTCSRTLFDCAQPARWSRAPASWCTPSRRYYANRGTLSLHAREIRHGRPRRAARPARAAPPAARRRGPVRPRAASGRCRSCPAASAWSPRPTPPPSATCSRTPAAAGRRSRFEVGVRRHAGHARRRRGDRGARPARPRRRRRRDRGRPRRRLGRGPAAVLRRGADPGGRTRSAPRWSPRSATSPTSPLLDLVADVRASTPTDAAKLVVPDVAEELPRRRAGPATGSAPRLAGWLDREQAGLDALRVPAGAGRPAHRCSTPAPTRSTRCATGPAAPCATASTGPPTTSATSGPGPGRCRRWPPCGAATPCSRTPTATSSTSVAGVAAGRRRPRPGRRRPRPRHHRPRSTEPDRAEETPMS